MLLTSSPKGLKQNIFNLTLSFCAREEGTIEAIEMVNAACPKDMKQNMFAYALSYCALKGKPQAVKMINASGWLHEKEASNEALSKTDTLAHALFTLASFRYIDTDRLTDAFNMLKNVCCKGIEEEVFSRALNLTEEDNNFQKAIDTLTDFYADNEAAVANIQAVKPDDFSLYAIAVKKVIKENIESIGLADKLSNELYNLSILKNKKAVAGLTENCPRDLSREVFSETLQKCCVSNKKEEIDILFHACSDDFKNYIFVHILIKNALASNQEVFKAVSDSCPENQKLTIFVNVLLNFAIENVQEGLDFVNRTCTKTEEFQLEIYVNALKNAALRQEQEAVKMISDSCPEKLKLKIFTNAMSFCAIQGSYRQAVNMIYDAFSHLPHLKTDLLSNVLFHAIFKDNQQAVEMINDIINRNSEGDSHNNDLKAEVIADVLFQYAVLGNLEKFKIVKELCPIDLEENILSIAFHKATDLNNVQKAWDKLTVACAEDLGLDTINIPKIDSLVHTSMAIGMISNASKNQIKLFSSELCIISKLKNKEAFDMLLEACPKDLKKEIYWRALADLSLKNEVEAFDMVKDNCPKGLKTEMYTRAMLYLALKDEQKALNMVKDACRDNLKNNDAFIRALFFCIMYGNKKAFDMVKDACPDNLKQHLFQGNKNAYDAIKDSCPENLKENLFDVLLADFALNGNQEGFNIVNSDISNDYKKIMFGRLFSFCVLANNKKAAEMVYDASSFLLKKDILSSALFKCIVKDNRQAAEMIQEICNRNPENYFSDTVSQKEVLADVLLQFAILGTTEHFYTLKNLCPEHLKEEILLKALLNVANLQNVERATDDVVERATDNRNEVLRIGLSIKGNHPVKSDSPKLAKKAIKMISQASEDLVALFSGVLSIKSSLKDKEAIQLFTDTCPNLEDTKEEVFLSALKSCCFFNREEEIGILIHACSEDLKKCIFLYALKYYALHGIGEMYNKPFEKLVNSCPEDIKPYIFTQALEDIQAYMYNLVLDDVKKYMCTKKKSPDEIEKNIFDQALNDSKINMHPKAFDIKRNQKALDIISEAHRGYLEKNNFLRAVEALDQEAVDVAIKNCPEDLKQQMFIQVLRDAVLKKDEKAVEMIVKSLPDLDFELRKNVFTKVRIDPGIKMDCEAYDMIERTYRKYPIKNIFFKLLQEKNQEAVGKLLTGCWPNLKKKMFPEALQKYALKKDKEVVDMILRTCPKELKEHMFIEVLKNPDLKEDKKAVEMVTEAYQQYSMSKMANPMNRGEGDNSKGIEKQKKHRKNTKKAGVVIN